MRFIFAAAGRQSRVFVSTLDCAQLPDSTMVSILDEQPRSQVPACAMCASIDPGSGCLER